jgi:hypothetical protein
VYRLPADKRWAALQELRSLATFVRTHGGDLVDMVSIPDDVRESFEAFCVAHPSEADSIHEAIAFRDFMLDHISRANDDLHVNPLHHEG